MKVEVVKYAGWRSTVGYTFVMDLKRGWRVGGGGVMGHCQGSVEGTGQGEKGAVCLSMSWFVKLQEFEFILEKKEKKLAPIIVVIVD